MQLRAGVGDHVPAATAVLSAVSLALVFAAALRVVPASALPHLGDVVVAAIPHVNAGISLVAIVVIAAGWRWARRGEIHRHRRAMIAGFGLFAAFLALYLYRVALEGPTRFEGTGAIRTAYYAVLGIHVTLAVICVPLLYYVLLLGVTRSIPDVRASRHPAVGRIAAGLWLTSFVLGVVVYALLYVR